jgi:DNA helicase IV
MNRFCRLLWGKPSSVTIRADLIVYEVDGCKGSLPLSEYRNSHCEDTILGLFGCDLILAGSGNQRVVIPGLKKKDAVFLKDRLDKEARELLIRKARAFIEKNEEEIEVAWETLQTDKYISKRELCNWIEKYSEIRGLAFIPESSISSEAAKQCLKVFLDPDNWRRSRNDVWVIKEIEDHGAFLDSVTGKSLTVNQKKAVVAHDNAVLVVAGAGTGKTTTVITKVAYLLRRGLCKAEDIMLLSFSKAAANELRERIASVTDKQIEARTFHSLGLEIVTEATGVKPAIAGKNTEKILIQILSGIMIEGGKLASQLVRYMAYDFYPDKKEHDFRSKKTQLSWATQIDITTLNGEQVKSNQEAQIANWLLLNGIRYEYESAYRQTKTGNRVRRVYKPDFYLPDYDIYIEHWGISRAGETRHGINREKYMEQMRWKQELHHKFETTLVETFSYQGFEGDLEQSLEKQLRARGVEIRPLSSEELSKMKCIRERAKVMATFLARCMALYKGNHESFELLSQKLQDPKAADREKRFLPIFESVLEKYQAILDMRGEIDFGDMITKAASLVRSGEYKSRFSVIIIDEFQDISKGRAFLIQCLLNQIEDARLTCVGDDWQSIYRFNGSDVSLMTEFDENWGDSIKINLDQTQRFGQELEELSTKFITSNPRQIQRDLKGSGSLGHAAVHITKNDAKTIIKEIQSTSALTDPDVLILGRYNHSIEKVDSHFKSMTAHQSKGLEADYVIIQDLGVGKYGFPSGIEDDPIISLFLAEREDHPNAEERRLFYVALTRARKEVWLIPAMNGTSPFIEELIEDEKYTGLVTRDKHLVEEGIACPECSGDMLVRTNRMGGVFLGCGYYPRCSGTISGCPKCGKSIPKRQDGAAVCSSCDWSSPACSQKGCHHGYKIQRTGPHGVFTGCSEFSKTGCRG